MIVQLKIDSGKLTFDPPFRELRDILLRLLTDIVQNAEDLHRVRRKCHAGIKRCGGHGMVGWVPHWTLDRRRR